MTKEIPHWNPEPPEFDRCWRNTNTGAVIGIVYNEEEDMWDVTGENSLIDQGETLERARSKAIEWMLDSPSPSPMV